MSERNTEAFIGGAYKTLASLEKRVSQIENEIVQHDVTIKEFKKPVNHTGIPKGYEVQERNGQYYWRTADGTHRAVYAEATHDLARVQAVYHFLRKQYEDSQRGAERSH